MGRRSKTALQSSVVLPPLADTNLARGASRHTRAATPSTPAVPIELMLPPTGPSSHSSHAGKSCDPTVAESHGNIMLGDKDWKRHIFDHIDGGADEERNTKGSITRSEFAGLAARLGQELGKPNRSSKFEWCFRDCDTNVDGLIAWPEWSVYADKVEEAYGSRTCKRATARFVGTRKAEPRTRLMPEGSLGGIWMFDGFNASASLRLVRTCAGSTRDRNLSSLPGKLQLALDQKADPNTGLADKSYNGYTPLIFLAMCTRPGAEKGGHLCKAVDLLISARADVHRENELMPFGQWGPLDFAAQLQSAAGVEALLTHVDVGDNFSWAASENVQSVMLAEIGKVCSEAVCRQIQSMARFNVHATVAMQLFASSITGGNLGPHGAKKLIAGTYEDDSTIPKGARADPDGSGLNGLTALMSTIKKGDIETVKALLEARASPMQEDAAGATPLHLAATALKPDIVEVLLEARADCSKLDRAKFSPWMVIGEAVTCMGGEEKSYMHDMLTMLQPEMSPENFLEIAERSLEDVFEILFPEGQKVTPEYLAKKVRLQESLFFDHRRVRRGAFEGREPVVRHLQRIGSLIISLLRTDPLKGNMKVLAKYLLEASMGPAANSSGLHISHQWTNGDNREVYRKDMKVAVKDMLGKFARECNAMKADIVVHAMANPEGDCAGLLALEFDSVRIPEHWIRESAYWKTVHDRQLLRYDPEWARGVHDGATCCLALMRLGLLEDLAGYSRWQQCHHASMSEMLARGFVKYSEMCNEPFQDMMNKAVANICQQKGIDCDAPSGYVAPKKIKRLMEKTRMAYREFGLQAWPELEDEYVHISHCFHIIDTVRMSFICKGKPAPPESELQEEEEVEPEPEVEPIPWRINHRPPEVDKEYKFENVKDTLGADSTLGYLGPDKGGMQGDPEFYFLIDLGKEVEVEKIEMVNAFIDPKEYCVISYEIAIGNDIGDFQFEDGKFYKFSTTQPQDIKIMGSGRYIRMNFKTYGSKSVGIGQIRVIPLVDREAVVEKENDKLDKAKEKRVGNMAEQVNSCMELFKGLMDLTLKQDNVRVLRAKSGFAEGIVGAGGYADVKLLILADMGTFTAFDGTVIPLRIVGEVQLILEGFAKVKSRMHLTYEVDRGSFDYEETELQSPNKDHMCLNSEMRKP